MKLLPGCTAPVYQYLYRDFLQSEACFPLAISLATGESYYDICRKINQMGSRFDNVPYKHLSALIENLVGPVEEYTRYKRSQCLRRWCQGKYNGAWVLRVIRRERPGIAHAMIVQNGQAHDCFSVVGRNYNARGTARVTDVWRMKERFRFL